MDGTHAGWLEGAGAGGSGADSDARGSRAPAPGGGDCGGRGCGRARPRWCHNAPRSRPRKVPAMSDPVPSPIVEPSA